MIRNLLCCLFLVTASVCYANPLTPEQALARLKESGMPDITTRSSSSLKPLFTLTEALDEPTLYVFENADSNGFIVVSADDATIPLLGYSVKNRFDKGEIPPALEYWLSEYSRQIQYMRDNNIVSPSTRGVIELPDWDPVAPLVMTKWNQDAPFNDLCPVIDGVKAPTGCIATAMAQAMKYFNYPSKGQGSVEYSYTLSDSNREITNSMDLSTLTFDWNNMIDNYNGNFTQAQATAVATLMKAAGFSVKMMYNTQSSGAYSMDIAQALVENFRYDKGIKFYYRSWYNYSNWGKLLYDNIKNVGPVIYNGNGEAGGHSFILDGYQSKGYFHFNWGWSGLSDGYFVLDALDPYSLGIGGGAGGFNFNQDAILNIRKPVEGTNASPQADMYILGSVVGSIEGSNTLKVISNDPNYPVIFYQGLDENVGDLGMKFEEVSNPQATPQILKSTNFVSLDLKPGYGYYINSDQAVSFDLGYVDLKSNTQYKATLVYGIMGQDWQDVFVDGAFSNYFYISKKGTGMLARYTITNEEIKLFTADDVELVSELYYEYPVKFKATLINETERELTNSATLVLMTKTNSPVFLGENFVYSIAPGESVETELSTSLEAVVSNPESYIGKDLYLSLLDWNSGYAYYISKTPVTLKQYEGGETVFSGTVTVDNASKENGIYWIENSEAFDVTTEIKVESGYFFNDVSLWIFEYQQSDGMWYSNTSFEYGYQEIQAGETSKMTLTASYPTWESDKLYGLMAMVKYNNGDYTWLPENQEIQLIRFMGNAAVGSLTKENSGIEFFYNMSIGSLTILSAITGIDTVEVFSLNGTRLSPKISRFAGSAEIDFSSMTGIVVVNVTDRNGNHKSKKLVL